TIGRRLLPRVPAAADRRSAARMARPPASEERRAPRPAPAAADSGRRPEAAVRRSAVPAIPSLRERGVRRGGEPAPAPASASEPEAARPVGVDRGEATAVPPAVAAAAGAASRATLLPKNVGTKKAERPDPVTGVGPAPGS